MKWLLGFLFSTFLMFGVSYVPSVTLAQTDDQAQAPAAQTEEGGPTLEDAKPADERRPEDDVTPPDENEGMMVPEVGNPTDEPLPEDDMSPPEG